MKTILCVATISIVVLCGCGCVRAQNPCPASHPCSRSTNFTADLFGDLDTRPGVWGRTASAVWAMPFHPPAGMRVRLLRVYGDVSALPHGKVPEGTGTWVLFSLQATTSFNGDPGTNLADFTSAGCPLFVQAPANGPVRIPFDYKVAHGGLLDADNMLHLKVATFENESGLSVHIEPTFVMEFQFERGVE